MPSACSRNRRASRRAPGRPRAWAKKPLRACRDRPVSRLSSTLIFLNSALFWKVRPMPRRAASSGWMRRKCSASNTTSPESGRYTPLRMLSSELLPAPLGPISAQISPRLTANDSALIALTPLNDREMSRTSRMFSAALMRLAPGIRGSRHG
ncbi:hypothetical protein D3C78_1505490 [compost metagenome]